jgi:hypothetical protein
MSRVTKRNLEGLVERINKITNSPLVPWRRNNDGRLRANIGNFHLSGAYGGYAVHRMVTDGGGIEVAFGGGYAPKRELWELGQAYINGLQAS